MQHQAPKDSTSKDNQFEGVPPCDEDSFNEECEQISEIDKHSLLTTSIDIQTDIDNTSSQYQNINGKSKLSKYEGISCKYTSNGGQSRQKKCLQQSQINICESILKQLNNHITSFPFRFPVDPDNQGLPDYYEKVVNPMDLQTIRLKLARDRYTIISQFYKDIELIISNSLFYNHKNDEFLNVTYQFQKIYLKLQKEYGEQESKPKAKRMIAQKKKREKQVCKRKGISRTNKNQIKSPTVKLFEIIEQQKQSVVKSITRDKQMSEMDKQTSQMMLNAQQRISQHDSSDRIYDCLNC